MKKYIPFLLFLLNIFSSTAFCQVIYTIAGNDSTFGYSGDGGPGINAKLHNPEGILLDGKGNLYICDVENFCIRKINLTSGGIMNTVAGNGHQGYSGDGNVATDAELNGAFDLAFDKKGNLYIADANNNCIRKVSISDTISTIAGTGTAGYNGDSIPAVNATLNFPTGIAVDSAGNIYIADSRNYRIRKIDTAGMITTFAGTGVRGYSPDNSDIDTVRLDSLGSLRFDKKGVVFFSDNVRIRKIDARKMTSIAGNGTVGYSGDGGYAITASIGGSVIDIDSSGDIFIADVNANRIRKISSSGTITTIAGGGVDLGENINPLSANLFAPQGVAVNANGDIYISDGGNNRVRVVTNHLNVNNLSTLNVEMNIYPNPCHDKFTIQINTVIKETAELTISAIDGKELYHALVPTNAQTPIVTTLPAGCYTINANTNHGHFITKLVIQ